MPQQVPEQVPEPEQVLEEAHSPVQVQQEPPRPVPAYHPAPLVNEAKAVRLARQAQRGS